MKFFKVYIVLVCLFPAGLIAQDSFLLTGNIRDASNTPIPQAMVFIEGTTMGTYADNNGKYSLEVIPGEYIVSVSAYGYSLQTHTIKINNNQNLDFTLKEQSIDISAVSVYGKSECQQLRESAYTVNAIEIKNRASSLNNINNLVGRSSGIIIREDGGVGSDFNLSINGLSGNSIRYFIDGVPLSSMGNGVSLANLPVNIVDRVEVYKGVVPAYLGSDALGGAINIITKKDKKNYLDASYGIGSFCTHKADFNAQYVHPISGLFIKPTMDVNYSKNNYEMRNVQVKDSVGRFDTTNTKRFHDDYLSILTQLQIGITDKKWVDLLSFTTSYFYSDDEIQTGSRQDWVYGMRTQERESYSLSAKYSKNNLVIRNLSASITLTHTWDEKITIDTAFRKYYWDGEHISSNGNERSRDSKSIKHIKRPLTIGRINLNYALSSKHSINVNYQLKYLTNHRYDDLDSEFIPSKDVFSKQVTGVSYNQEFWNNKLQNTLFYKNYRSHLIIDQQEDANAWASGADTLPPSCTKYNHGYGLSTRLELLEQFAIKGSYEHSVRLPIAREVLGNGETTFPNFGLHPENSENINWGLFGTFHNNSLHRLYYETNLFYREVKDYIQKVQSATEDGISKYENVNNVTVKGVEAELQYSYNNKFQLSANFTYLNERDKTKYLENGESSASYNNRMPNRPWLFGNLVFNYRMNGMFGYEDNQLEINYSYQYVHWFYVAWENHGAYNKEVIPRQFMNNAQFTYSLKNKKYNISFECKNILDHTLYDNYKMQKPGRSFYLKLRMFIN